MEQKQSNLVTFWKRLFGTTEKKKQEGLDKQTSSSTWQKLREKTDPNNNVFPESGFVVIFLTDNDKRRSGAINKQEETSSKRSFLLLRVQKAQKFKSSLSSPSDAVVLV